MDGPPTTFTDLNGRYGYSNLWTRQIKGQGVGVAVLDTGVDPLPELGDSLVQNRDFTDEACPKDGSDLKHGTSIARLIHLVAPKAKLANLKVLPIEAKARREFVVDALSFCTESFPRFRIVNLSISFPLGFLWWSHRPGQCLLCQAVNNAVEAGIHVIAAAGNEGPHAGTITCPGTAEKAITVAAVETKEQHDWWRRKPVWKRWWLRQTGWLGRYCGTSYSSAYVTGGVALILSAVQDVKPEELGRCIKEVGYRSPGMEPWQAGAGQVNWEKLLSLLIGADELERLYPPKYIGQLSPQYRDARERIYWTGRAAQRPDNAYVTDCLDTIVHAIEDMIQKGEIETALKETSEVSAFLIPGRLPEYEDRLAKLRQRCVDYR